MGNFVKCRIALVPTKSSEMYEDLGIDDPNEKEVELYFRPDAVTAYREAPDLDGDGLIGVTFYLPDGEYFIEGMTVKEFEQLIGVQT